MDAIGDELSTLVLNTYTETEVGNLITGIDLSGSGNINITNNPISWNFSLKINDEVCSNPRAYGNAVFEMISGTDNFAFRQNTIHGGQPITQSYSSTKECTFFGDCSIPNVYDISFIDTSISIIYNDTHIKTEINTLIPNIELSN